MLFHFDLSSDGHNCNVKTVDFSFDIALLNTSGISAVNHLTVQNYRTELGAMERKCKITGVSCICWTC